MSERRRLMLRVLGTSPDDAPRASSTIDAARERLGGRGTSDGEVGGLVRVPSAPGAPVGVVLFRSEGKLDVWTGDGRVRRLPEDAVHEVSRADVPEALRAAAARVRDFAALREGAPVRFERREGTVEDAVLLEKHRYGGLVRREDRVVAVGFRRLWPVPRDLA